MKKIVIFGASGFIGSHFVKYLKKCGIYEIIAADIVAPKGPIYKNVKFFSCDVREKISSDLIAETDMVINLAAVHRTPGHEDYEYFDTNVKGARNVVEFCERTGCNTLWFTSSISVYGPSEEPMYETSILKPESAYGMSKQQAEAIHRAWQEKDPCRKLVVARPAVVFGARENGNFTRLAKALKRGYFAFPGRTDTIKGCGYVEDLIGSFFFMQEQPDPFILFNYCYPTAYTIEDICNAFVKVAYLHRPLSIVPLPLILKVSNVFQYLDSIGLKNGIHPERIYKLIRSTYIVPGELLKCGYPYQTDIEEGLRRWLADDPEGEFV